MNIINYLLCCVMNLKCGLDRCVCVDSGVVHMKLPVGLLF
jgi:hypothetical protein